MITGKEVKVLDINAKYYGTPPEKLMENAGKHIAEYIKQKYTNPKVLILCGPGNNGGDGFVAARYLSKLFSVTLFLIGTEEDIRTDIARMNFSKLKSLAIDLHDRRHIDLLPSCLNEATIIVDAMLGVGIQGVLRKPYDEIVMQINQQKNKDIISVDVPTGMKTKTAIHPKITITFHDTKPDMDKKTCGTIIIADIQIPKKAQTQVGPGELSIYYPRPKPDSHKGQNGRVLIIGGGPFTGAPALSAMAALRTGADLTWIATPKEAARTIASFSPNLIVHPIQSNRYLSITDIDNITAKCDQVDSILIGPGLGSHRETNTSILRIISHAVNIRKKMVIDADAIKPLHDHYDLLQGSETVITPHAQEFTYLTGEKLAIDLGERQKQVSDWAQKLNVTLFLKGSTDVLSNGSISRLNTIHNPSMTVGGTGDVLAGIIAALLAKQSSPMTAARIAAFLNGEAGNIAFKKYSYGLLPTDIIESIPVVLSTYV